MIYDLAASASSAGDGSDYGTQPGYGVASDCGTQPGYGVASDCGTMHGAFNAFGKDFNLAGGADGQQTGINNSAKGCQRNV